MVEVWRDIPGYEGRYQASTFGRIKSLDRYVTQTSRWGAPFIRALKGKLLRPGKYNKDGHLSVVLGRGTNGIPVHKLVMITFVGKRPKDADIRHLDGNPQNNRLDNLAYGTRTQNILDVYSQGKAWRDTTKEQAIKVKALLKEGYNGKSISLLTGVSINTIYAIKQGKNFTWLDKGVCLL